MALDPMKRDTPNAAQRLGVTTRRITEGVGRLRDNTVMRPLQALDQAHASAQQAAGNFVRDFGASYTAGKPVAAPPPVVAPPMRTPVRNPAGSTVGVGGSTPAGGVPAPSRPSFGGVQGQMRSVAPPPTTGIQRSVVGGVPTFTGTGDYAPNAAVQPQAVARPAFTQPSIAHVGTPGVTNQTENTDQRRAREAAISEIGTQLFLNRGKTTRSARDFTGELLRTQGELVSTAGNQAVALKNNDLDQQTRTDMLALQQNGENARAVLGVRGDNERASLLDAGDTERERIKLERPSLLTDREGGYLLLNPAQGVARPLLSNGQQVRGNVDGAITPVDRLSSLQDELAASQQSLTPNTGRIDSLERQIDAIRSGNSSQGGVASGYTLVGITKDGRKVYRDASGKHYSEERKEGAP
jgi:hypothetical protein